MPIGAKESKYTLRARVIGTIVWSCPICGHFNRSSIPPGAYRVRCSNSQCHRKFVYGLRFYPMPGGGKIRGRNDLCVPDWRRSSRGPLDEPFPEAELSLDRYQPGQRVNEILPFLPSSVENSAEGLILDVGLADELGEEEDDEEKFLPII